MMPSMNWPKPFLLTIHEQAVEHGYIFIEPISEADAQSLRARLYRIRRRSDASMAAFIPPEYHLVMVGKWEAGPSNTGRLPVIYNKRSDGLDLPGITVATGADIEALAVPDIHPEPIDLDNLPTPQLDAESIEDFVAKLTKDAQRRARND